MVGVAHDLVRLVGAVEHVGVGHPHHRQVHVALAPAVAALRATFLAGPEVVPHVVGEHPVLDEHVVLAGVAFVVDADRAPLGAHRAVVDERDERRGDQLAGLVAVDAGALRDQVCLEAVAARLVEQHAAAALLDDHGHRATRRRPGAELGDRHAGRVTSELGDVDAVEHLEPDRLAGALEAGLHAGVAGRDDAHPYEAPYLLVLGEHTVGVGHQYPAAAVAVAGRHLHDRSAGRPGGLVDAPEQLDLRSLRHLVGVSLDRVHLGAGASRERHRAHSAPTLTGCGCSLFGGRHETGLAEIGRVGEPRGVTLDDADAGAPVAAAGDLFDAAVVERHGRGPLVLGEHLGEVRPAPHRRAEHPGQDILVDHQASLPKVPPDVACSAAPSLW